MFIVLNNLFTIQITIRRHLISRNIQSAHINVVMNIQPLGNNSNIIYFYHLILKYFPFFRSLRLSDIIPESLLRPKSNSESNDGKEELSDITNSNENLSTCDFFVDESLALQEMFPDSSALEIKHCIAIANGDIDQAIQMILDREETGESLTGSLSSGGHKSQKVDDNELKNRIISRYSYVDRSTESKEYKPVVPKIEPKKMIRYRDNKIVSLRGERYTEVRKGEEVELRKPKKHHITPP